MLKHLTTRLGQLLPGTATSSTSLGNTWPWL